MYSQQGQNKYVRNINKLVSSSIYSVLYVCFVPAHRTYENKSPFDSLGLDKRSGIW